RQTVAALLESEQRFRQLADSAPVLIWMAGPDRAWTYCSQSWLRFTGRQLEEELGRGWLELVHPEDREQCWNISTAAWDARQPFQVEFRLRRHDGEYRWLLSTGVPRFTHDAHLLGYIGSCVDISERKCLEQQLAQALKMEALGRLAGGVAHDFNNLLTVISSSASLVLSGMEPGHPWHSLLTAILKAGDRGADLTRQLLALSRKQLLRPQVL